MPYINSDLRVIYDGIINEFEDLVEHEDISVGELNFLITSFMQIYVQTRGTSYQKINDIMGVLECVKQEFYRRLVVPYEELKRESNGEVFNLT